jgi:hypothetical protein
LRDWVVYWRVLEARLGLKVPVKAYVEGKTLYIHGGECAGGGLL